MKYIIPILLIIFIVNSSFANDNNTWIYNIGSSSKGVLSVSNNSTEPICDILKTDRDVENYDFSIRIANENNKEGKTHSIKSEKGTLKISNPIWGLVWDYVDNENYSTATLQGYNDDIYNINDNRYLTLTIAQKHNGVTKALEQISLTEMMNMGIGFNTLKVRKNGDEYTIYAGDKELRKITTVIMKSYNNCPSVGYIVGPGSKIKVSNVEYNIYTDPKIAVTKEWDKQKLDAYLSESEDNIEGYWEYFDRSLNENILRLGGKYTFAIVKNTNNGYDIIYVSGATINAKNWHFGMKKGEITATNYTDVYNAVWYDAMFGIFDKDIYVRISYPEILTLAFPLQKSELRFSRKRLL